MHTNLNIYLENLKNAIFRNIFNVLREYGKNNDYNRDRLNRNIGAEPHEGRKFSRNLSKCVM